MNMKRTILTLTLTLVLTLLGCDDEQVVLPKDDTVYVDSIATNLTTIHDMKVGDSIQFYAYAFPKDAKDTTLIWESSDPDIVSISSDGLAISLRKGEAILCINAKKGGYGIGSVMRANE